jgi:hypothetical protein
MCVQSNAFVVVCNIASHSPELCVCVHLVEEWHDDSALRWVKWRILAVEELLIQSVLAFGPHNHLSSSDQCEGVCYMVDQQQYHISNTIIMID